MSRQFRFPDSFLWGAATASHQVEGDNRHNDWWRHEQEGRLPPSGIACDHFRRYESDFDLAKSLGHNAHRLSIEWSRIEPEEGKWSDAALDHYARVIDALRQREIEPLVTLHHFTNPAWFAARGGWRHGGSVGLFRRYARRVVERLAGVRYWITVNEPTVYLKNCYIVGEWPPFERSSWLSGFRVLANLARAHVGAYRDIHSLGRPAEVGLAHSAPYVVACGHRGLRDRAAARARDFVLNGLYFHLLMAASRARRCFDFIGVNYYTRMIVRGDWGRVGGVFGSDCPEDHHQDRGPANELGWEVYAPGLLEVLRRFARYGVPLIVTENGLATTDDGLRCEFIREHVRFLARALSAGIDVRGYLHWTLMDNHEWSHGSSAHFGLAAVERDTLARQLRPSAHVYEEICRRNAVTLPEGNPDSGVLRSE